MSVNNVVTRSLDICKNVKKALKSSSNSLSDFCIAINKCNSDKSQRYMLNSMDSIFDGLKIPEVQDINKASFKQQIAHSLIKIPKAIYSTKEEEKAQDISTDLGFILENCLDVETANFRLDDYSKLFNQLKDTSLYIVKNSLQGSYGPLRDTTIQLLDHYKKILLSNNKLNDLKKLVFYIHLLDVLKLHSIDSHELHDAIISILNKTPTILKHCELETLDCLSKLKLPPKPMEMFEEHIRTLVMTCKDMALWSGIFGMLMRNSDNRNTLEFIIHSYKYTLANVQRLGGGNGEILSNAILLNIIDGVIILQKRVGHSDELLSNANSILESLFPFIEKQIDTFDTDEIILLFNCFSGALKIARHPIPNCMDTLIKEIYKRSDEYLLKDWIDIFEFTNRINDVMVANVLPRSNQNFIKLAELLKFWVTEVSDALKSTEVDDLFDTVSSLSIPQCSNLIKYLVTFDQYTTPVNTILERKFTHLLSKLNSSDHNIYEYYYAQLILALPEGNSLRLMLESSKSLDKIFAALPVGRLVRLLEVSRGDVKLLLDVLSERLLMNMSSLNIKDSLSLLKYGKRFNDVGLCNALLSSFIPAFLQSKDPRNGYMQLLDVSKHVLHLPKFDDYSPCSIIDELVVHHAPLHIRHLTLAHLELLLRNIHRYGHFPSDLMKNLLSHAMDIDLQNTSIDVIIGMIEMLSTIRIRHEMLLKRLIDWSLSKMRTQETGTMVNNLVKIVEYVKDLGMSSNDLNNFLTSLIQNTGDEGLFRKPFHYEDLGLKNKIDLLHASSIYGTVTLEFESRFEALLREFKNFIKDNEGNASILRAGTYRRLYEIYINMLINGSYNAEKNKELTTVLQELPCYHWFKKQDQLCLEFRNSTTYVSIKNILNELGCQSADSKVTEVYFCHFVIEKGGNAVIICVPKRDVLNWWTPLSSEHSGNHIESYKVVVGKSNRLIEHLKKSGWIVNTIYTSNWETLDHKQRTEALKEILKDRGDNV